MKTKSIACLIMAALILFLLCGCDVYSADTAELLSPPALSGDISPIADIIKKSVTGDFTMTYPSRGNYRSAVIQNDIDGDGILEAFAFCSTDVDDTVTMYMNIISNTDGKWQLAAQQKIVAGGVDRIDFCDLDGDGTDEILVGWEIYGTSEMQLAVYSFTDGKITQRMLQKYNHFVWCDLDGDGGNEILIIKLNIAEQLNSASLYMLSDEGVTESYSCELDKTLQSVNEPIVSHLSSGKAAVYIDEIKGVGAVTEVLFIEKNKMVNPLMNPESRETTDTLRASNISVKDINNDGIIEIPVQINVPSLTKSDIAEKLYITNWCSYNGETLTTQMTTMINSADGYYYSISSKWLGKIAFLKDTDLKLREIYRYDSDNFTTGEQLLSFKTVKKSDWDNGKYKNQGYLEITNDEISAYLCKISNSALADGIDIDAVRKNFVLVG